MIEIPTPTSMVVKEIDKKFFQHPGKRNIKYKFKKSNKNLKKEKKLEDKKAE